MEDLRTELEKSEHKEMMDTIKDLHERFDVKDKSSGAA